MPANLPSINTPKNWKIIMTDKWNNLLNALDLTYGGQDRTTSRYKVTKQSFDNDKQEHIVYLEYRFRRNTTAPGKEVRRSKEKEQQRQKEKQKARVKAYQNRKRQTYNLLRDINANTSVKYEAGEALGAS